MIFFYFLTLKNKNNTSHAEKIFKFFYCLIIDYIILSVRTEHLQVLPYNEYFMANPILVVEQSPHSF